MPLDTNFAVVTVILGGLLVWSLTQKADAPKAEIDPRTFSPPFDGPVDMDIEKVVGKKPGTDARAPQLKQHIINIVDYLQGQKTKFDVMMRDMSGTATVADLERKHKQVANELRYTIAQCSNWSSDFIVWRRMLVDFGEDEWVKTHMPEFAVPDNVRNNLTEYERSVTQNVFQHNQMNVIQYENMAQDDYTALNQNQRYNADADDAFMVHKGGQYKDYSGGGYIDQVFMNTDGQSDDVTLDAAQEMHGQTSHNPIPKTQYLTQTNQDAYNTLSPDGRLGSGALDDRADDHDMRAQNLANQAAQGGDTTTLAGGGAFTKAKQTETDDTLSPAPYMKAANEQITADAKQLAARVAELEKASKVKEAVAEDVAQDLDVGESGGISKGVTAEQAAVYTPAPATTSQANESDAAPAKPKPQIPEQASGGAVVGRQSLPQIAGKKRYREDTSGTDPFVAVVTGKEKKVKPSPAVVPPDPEEEELDLTEGTKRGGADPELGPERRGDLEASENQPVQLTAPATGTVTEEPLGGGKGKE